MYKKLDRDALVCLTLAMQKLGYNRENIIKLKMEMTKIFNSVDYEKYNDEVIHMIEERYLKLVEEGKI